MFLLSIKNLNPLNSLIYKIRVFFFLALENIDIDTFERQTLAGKATSHLTSHGVLLATYR